MESGVKKKILLVLMDITKKNVSKAVIFSFANMEEIELDVDTLKFG